MTKARLFGLLVVMAGVGVLTGCFNNGGPFIAIPLQVAGLSAQAGNGTVILVWAPYTKNDFEGYNVYRGTAAAGPFSKIAALIAAATFTDTGLANGTTYYYNVTVVIHNDAKGGTLESPASSTVSTQPHGDVTSPSIPTGFVAYGANAQVVLQWNANPPVEGVAYYNLYRNTAPGVSTQLKCPEAPEPLPAPPPSSCLARSSNLTFTDTGVTNGSTYWYVLTAVDGVGNESAPSLLAQATPVADITRPVTTITGMPPALTNSSSATFLFIANEPSTFQCKVDAGNYAACNSGVTFAGLSDGSHTFSVRATDLSGNVEQPGPSYTWTVDTTPPDTQITSNPPSPEYTGNATFAFTSTEAGSSFQCSLDNAAFTGCSSGQSYNGLSDGSHNFRVRATDPAGNTDASPASYTWTVDATPPETTLTGGPCNLAPNCATNQVGATFTFTSNKAGSTFQCKLDGGAYAPCTSPNTVAGPLAEGNHTFSVFATDVGNHVDATPATFSWLIDTTDPITTLGTGPCNLAVPCNINTNTVTFTFSSSEPATQFTCTLTGPTPSPASPCGSGLNGSKTYNGLADGSYTFTVKSTDAAGNDPGAGFPFTVDTTAPTVTVTFPNGGENIAVGVQATITWTSSDAGTGIVKHDVLFSPDGGANYGAITECQNLPGTAQSCNATPPTDAISSQARIKVVATDLVNNAGEDASDSNFSVSDQTPPTVVVTAPAPGESVPTSPGYLITWISSDNVGLARHDVRLSTDSGVNYAPIPECQNLSGSAQSCSWDPPDINSTTARIVVCARDSTSVPPAPNTQCDDTDGDFNLAFDTTPPDTTIDSNPPNPSNATSVQFTFSGNDPPPTPSGINRFECQLTGDGLPGGFQTCTSPFTSPVLSDATYTFDVRAVDNAGNADPSPASYTWTQDSTPPVVAVTAPNGGEFLAGGANFSATWTASDGTGTGITTINGEYSIDNGSNWNPATGCTALPGTATTCDWVVPTATDSQQALFRMAATDGATNNGNDVSDAVFTIDSTLPTSTINSGPLQPQTISTAATFTFSGTDNFTSPANLAFQCKLDFDPYAGCTSPQNLFNIPVGLHTYFVQAIDEAGNIESTATWAWTVITGAAPTSLHAVSVNNQVRLAWTGSAPPGVDHYNVHRSTAPGFVPSGANLIGTAPQPLPAAPMFTDSAAAPNVLYYYKVVAAAAGNYGTTPPSNEFSITNQILSDSVFGDNMAGWVSANAGTPVTQWHITGIAFNSPGLSFYDGDDATQLYNDTDGATNLLITPVLTFAPGNSYGLKFMSNSFTQNPFDRVRVFYSTNPPTCTSFNTLVALTPGFEPSIRDTTGFEPVNYDLTALAGQSTCIAFIFQKNNDGVNDLGTFIDDVQIQTITAIGTTVFTEGFGDGVGCASDDNVGMWDSFDLNAGPTDWLRDNDATAGHSAPCVRHTSDGSGNYSTLSDAWLILEVLDLTSTPFARLTYVDRYAFGSGDSGILYIFHDPALTAADCSNLAPANFAGGYTIRTGSNAAYSSPPYSIDLSPYTSQKICVVWREVESGTASPSQGWRIDDVIVKNQ